MDKELRKLLADCLRELEASGDMEACLRRYPERAQELRPYLEMATSLGGQRLAEPSPMAQMQARQRLLSQLASLNEERRGVGQMTIFGQRLVHVAAGILVGVFLVGGLQAASAVPGSPVPGPVDAVPFFQGGDEDAALEALEAQQEAEMATLKAQCEAAEEELEAQHEAAEAAFVGTEAEEAALEAQHEAAEEAQEAQCKAAKKALEAQHEAEEEALEGQIEAAEEAADAEEEAAEEAAEAAEEAAEEAADADGDDEDDDGAEDGAEDNDEDDEGEDDEGEED